MGIAVELVQGTARDFPFQVTNPDGTTPTGVFLNTDVLTAKVWAGSNEAALLTPTVSWISATNAQYQVTLQNTDSAGLPYGIYYLQAYATRAGTPARPRRSCRGAPHLRSSPRRSRQYHGRPTLASLTYGRSPPGLMIFRSLIPTRDLTIPARTRETGLTNWS